jgi:peptidyl-prolyl cis-trans isomerase C
MRYPGWLTLLILAACSSGHEAFDSRPLQGDIAGPLAETVNGTPVPQALLDAVARARDLDLRKPDQRAQALNLLTDYVLLAQAAQQDKLFADETFRADVEVARLQGVGNATIGRAQRQAPITDAAVRAEYDAQVARSGKFEFDFVQLLFDNEADALKAQAELATGKSFAGVYDDWQARARQAKAFMRVRADQVPDGLASALGAMKAGETTKAPVRTEFGWHVVHLDAVNAFVAPSFEQLKDSVRQNLILRGGRERLQKLKEQAKIDYPPGAAPPAPVKPEVPRSKDDIIAVEKVPEAAKKKN